MGFFDGIKQAMQMRSEAKRLQSEIEKITVEYSNGGITATARGDMTITSIKIAPETWAEVVSGKKERFETMLFSSLHDMYGGTAIIEPGKHHQSTTCFYFTIR